ncbi:glycosyltransferase [Leptospira sp. FAT2]|uniref:glycosyltransferase n=1 Tax=Leptospira sanjuanensis TaxID=2879643 RepID=UPI001EE8E17C|nr:glycosyltransferase [Leptospira sanjuanensis]MCG6167628.1 glycosyltransferase [Leptospira sanjuanensis]MCG6193044.1 glycosyltransferase [Leptospira sanjuanensis]
MSPISSPQFSIVVPCYNYGQFIEETIDSIRKQTYTDWEIIIVDDGSDDEYTLHTLRKLSEEQENLTLLRLPINSGPSKARNFGIENAKGKYILPLDSDDKINPSYLFEAISVFNKNPRIGIVYCEAEFFGNLRGRWNLPEYRFPDILLENCIFVSAIFKKSDWKQVGGFSSNTMKNEWEDFDFWLKLIERGVQVYKIPKVLFCYRVGHTSRSSRSIQSFLPLYMQLFENHKNLYVNNIELLFRRHLEAKELEETFLVFTKIPLLFAIIKALSRFLKAVSVFKRRLFNF